MARARSPKRDKALQLWTASGKSRKLKDIAEELEVSEEQIRKWKNQDKWDKVTLPKGNSNVTNHRGGQPGNKNAAGHGGTGPPGNKNAVKTGEFEALFFDTLDDDEKDLVDAVPMDKEKLLLQEIQLLTVRERRMLKRIEDLKHTAEESGTDKVPSGMSVTKFTAGIEKGHPTDLKEYEGILGQIQSVEDALTRVQARKQKAIEALHRFGYDDSRLELENMKLELTILKQGGSEEGIEEDGFLDAMTTSATDLWRNTDE